MSIRHLVGAIILSFWACHASAATVEVVHTDGELSERARGFWSSLCIANFDVETPIAAQYRYGEEGEWQDIEIKQNYVWRFSQQFHDEPLSFTIKFLSAGTELSYVLDGAETRLRPGSCRRIENYEFRNVRDGSGSIDLIHVD